MTLPRLDVLRGRLEGWINDRSPRSLPKDWRDTMADALSRLPVRDDLCRRTVRVGTELPCRDGGDLEFQRRACAAIAGALESSRLPEDAAILLHGSCATGRTTPFSDVDTILLLDESALDEANLRRLRAGAQSLLKALYSQDPLMHHGLGVLFRGELRCYDQSALPLDAIERSVELTGQGCVLDVSWHPGLSRAGAAAKMRRQLDALHRAMGPQPLTLYRQKCLLSVLLLLPCLVVETFDGVFPYKRESFELARRHFDGNEWRAVTEASRMRRDWRLPRPLAKLGALIHAPASPLAPAAGRKLIAALSAAFGGRFAPGFLEDVRRFLDRCERILHHAPPA